MLGVKIYHMEQEGYEKLHVDGTWCVASVCHCERIAKATKQRLERHLETDEVFVLLQGNAKLYLGEEMQEIVMTECCIYFVDKGVWHTITTEPGTKVLIVEKSDTGPENTEYWRNLHNDNEI